jgi:hypothetical protein
VKKLNCNDVTRRRTNNILVVVVVVIVNVPLEI